MSARESTWDACERGEVPRGGQVALEGFPVSIWPRASRGRGPPVVYGGRRRNKVPGGERDGGEGLSVISKTQGPLGNLKISPI